MELRRGLGGGRWRRHRLAGGRGLGRVLWAGLWLASWVPAAVAQPVPDRWESAIQRFERQDRENPPAQGGVLFLGSSSLRLWKLQESFPDLRVLNRGFGGSQISDSLRHLHRILPPPAPRVLVFYAGDNDIAAGKLPPRVLSDYRELTQEVHRRLPDCRIVFLSIKPSLARWHLVEEMRQANRLVETLSNSDPRLFYLDLDTPMLGEDGRPRAELFVDDGLHLNARGYELWTSLLAPVLRHLLADGQPAGERQHEAAPPRQ